MDDLALQVRAVDDVEVGDSNRANARGCQVDQHRRAEPAGAHGQDFAVDQFALTERPTWSMIRWRE